MRLKAVGKAFLLVAAVAAISCGEDAGEISAPADMRSTSPEVRSTNKVLILGSTVSGGVESREARAVAAAERSTQIDVVTPEQWRAMTAHQFMSYKALIIGDAACQRSEAAFQAAIDTREAWGAIIDGNVVILSTDPTTNHTPQLVENAIRFVLESPQYRTGMYIALGCAYQNSHAPTPVTLLEPFGTFKVQGVPGCANTGHVFNMYPPTLSENISDAVLTGNGCAARSVFTAYPERNFSFAALAVSSEGKRIPNERPYHNYVDFPRSVTEFKGAPYLLVRGASHQGAGCGGDPNNVCVSEECDLGDGINGQPALPGNTPRETCSFSCRRHWCGDGVVDRGFGEECDEGANNGRALNTSGGIGTCSASCKRLAEASSHPPVAVCQDVTVVAEYTCSEYANIDGGSYDPDNDLEGCTQSPASPYPIGPTVVTLTCTDRAGHTSTCTGTVTVVDRVPPDVTLTGPEQESLECVKGATYDDPGATAQDICEGPLPFTRTGSVDMGVPGTYSLSYGATDASGNTATPATRTVTVSDTLAPQIQVRPGPSIIQCNGTPYVDPGATASDLCSGDLTPDIVVTSNLDQSRPGEYTVTYRVADAAGHVSTAVRPLTVGPCTGCIELRLGDYNLFLLEDYNGGHDVVGKVAAGGNITMTDFAVGTGLPANDTERTLVAGGNLTLSRGAVWGDAWYGGSYSADQTVSYPRGTVAQGTPIDFAARFAELRSLSSQLASMPANGTTRRESWGGIMLRGTNPSLNIFDVDASAFTGAKLLSIDAPAGSLAVLNIRGASATFTGFGHEFRGGIDQHGVLFNFVDTTSINAHGYGFWGTVLAPYADITFNNGSWDGGIYAKSLTGNAEGHINPLHDRNTCPSEPPQEPPAEPL